MPLAKDIMGGGFSPGQARAITGSLNNNLAAAGSTQATAAPFEASTANVTGASGTNGVILSAFAEARDSQMVFNNSGSSLNVYPPVGAAIVVPGTGAGSVNAAYVLTTYGVAIFTRITSTQWAVNKSA